MVPLVGVVLAALGSVDWIAWLSLRGTDPAARAAILSALTSLVVALGRTSGRLLSVRHGAQDDDEDEYDQSIDSEL